MTYITDEEIAARPDDSEEAFVVLERIARARYEDDVRSLDDNESNVSCQQLYMMSVLPLVKHLNIDELSSWERPEPNHDDWQTYDAFMTAVGYAVMTLRLRTIDRTTLHSVAFDPAAKAKLRHLLIQMRDTVDGLDVSLAKKEALFKKINALQDEIDRDRTRYQAYAALAIEACDDAGRAAKKLAPVKRLIESVGGVFGGAKRTEDAQPKLPPRRERKRISPPKFVSAKTPSLTYFDKPRDDEIPF